MQPWAAWVFRSVTNSNAVIPSELFSPLCAFKITVPILLLYFTFSKITAELLQPSRKVANLAVLVTRSCLSVGCIVDFLKTEMVNYLLKVGYPILVESTLTQYDPWKTLIYLDYSRLDKWLDFSPLCDHNILQTQRTLLGQALVAILGQHFLFIAISNYFSKSNRAEPEIETINREFIAVLQASFRVWTVMKTQVVWANSICNPYANSWMKLQCLFPIPYFFLLAFPLLTVFSPGWFPELSNSMSQAPFQAYVCSSTAPQLFLNVSRTWLVQIGTVCPAVWGSAVHVGSELASDGFIFWTPSLISEETMKNILYPLRTLFPFFATCSWGHHFPRLMNHNLPSWPMSLFFLVVFSELFTWWNNGTSLDYTQGMENHVFIQQHNIVFFCSLFCS